MDEPKIDSTSRPEQRPVPLLTDPSVDPSLAERAGTEHGPRKLIGRIVGIVIILLTLLILAITVYVARVNPDTHDASLGADYIGLTPQVSGRVVALYVNESSCVDQGTLLVQIDPHDYEINLQKALSDQQNLEAQIRDRERQIQAGKNQAHSSYDKLRNSKTDLMKSTDQVASSHTDVEKAIDSVNQAHETYRLAELKVERNRPLAEREYISRQQFDQYVTERDNDLKLLNQAEENLIASELKESSSQKTEREAAVNVDESAAGYRRDEWTVPTLDSLLAQRPAKASEVEAARTDLERTRIRAPLNGCVTALNISQGAYARSGSALFTLIDNNSWYVSADYPENELRYIRPGMKASVYLMSDPDYGLNGWVQSIGHAVQSSDTTSVGGSPGQPGSLPVVERSMNWVRLASRYPVRIRFTPRSPGTLRIGTTADVTILR